jgi:hypothetical protein
VGVIWHCLVCRKQWHTRDDLRRAGVNSFGDLFDHLAIEGGDVVRLAAGHEPLIDDDFFIDPICAGILEVGLNRMVRRYLAALDEAGVDQRPGAVADCGDRLAGLGELPHELKRPFVGS